MPRRRSVVSRSINFTAGTNYDLVVNDCVVDCLEEIERELGTQEFDVETVNVVPVQILSGGKRAIVDIVLVITVVAMTDKKGK